MRHMVPEVPLHCLVVVVVIHQLLLFQKLESLLDVLKLSVEPHLAGSHHVCALFFLRVNNRQLRTLVAEIIKVIRLVDLDSDLLAQSSALFEDPCLLLVISLESPERPSKAVYDILPLFELLLGSFLLLFFISNHIPVEPLEVCLKNLHQRVDLLIDG